LCKNLRMILGQIDILDCQILDCPSMIEIQIQIQIHRQEPECKIEILDCTILDCQILDCMIESQIIDCMIESQILDCMIESQIQIQIHMREPECKIEILDCPIEILRMILGQIDILDCQILDCQSRIEILDHQSRIEILDCQSRIAILDRQSRIEIQIQIQIQIHMREPECKIEILDCQIEIQKSKEQERNCREQNLEILEIPELLDPNQKKTNQNPSQKKTNQKNPYDDGVSWWWECPNQQKRKQPLKEIR
jgi:hypothetical protein